MLNCTDVACTLHHHEDPTASHLQDHRAHHEHQEHVMSGDASGDDNDFATSYNETDEALKSHVDAPSEGMYMLCGVLIAMFLVAVIIILLAVTISKLRKREDSSVTVNNNTINNNSTANNTTTVIQQQPQQQEAVETRTPAVVPTEPPPFFWRYSNSSQFSLSTNDQSNLVPNIISSEEISECKGFRKNLRGKWRRLVKKKAPTEVYAIPAEFQDQLKQIYVY